MSDARNCPECFQPIAQGRSSCPCGWIDPISIPKRQGGAGPDHRDPAYGSCDYTDRGLRCTAAGGISTSTHGGGPWYCRQHIDVIRGRSLQVGKDQLDHESLNRIKAAQETIASHLTRAMPKRQDAEATAERLAIQAEEAGK